MLNLARELKTDTVPLNIAVTRRRATQGFKPDPVPDEILKELLGLALLAPSGYNLQPWRFIVVKDAENRKRLRAAAMKQEKVEEAPVVIIAYTDPQSWRTDIDESIKMAEQLGAIRDAKIAEMMKKNASGYLESQDMKVWATKQTMIAYTQLMLLAETYGLDTAPMEGFWEDKVKAEFWIPDNCIVLALLAIGYAGKPDRPFAGRFDLSKVISSEHYGNPF